jgi:NAD(P)-dependent dehydrogenase (short-subunit alcohol dehydrogenase family)
MRDSFFHWNLRSMPDQSGRRIIVTGASSGLGAIMTRELAKRGAEVVLAVRDIVKGQRVADKIRATRPDARLQVGAIELTDLDSVRAFAARMTALDKPIDALILNAGVGNQPYVVTADGIESTFAANVVGHFELTSKLLPLLERAQAARVVSVGSNLYRRVTADVDFSDLSFEHDHSPHGAYVVSKVATVLFAVELENRLRERGSSVKSFIAHPGLSKTPMHNAVNGIVAKSVMTVAHATVSRDPEEGVLPLLFVATSSHAETGRFIGWHLRRGDKRIWSDEIRGVGLNRDLAQQMWEAIESVTATRESNG